MRKLLLFSVSMLLSVCAFAQWEKPSPKASTFEFDKVFYLYNKEAGVFFTEGNDWNTRTSYADTGLKVRFTQYIPDGGEWDGKTVIFNDSSVFKQAWNVTFIDNETSAYVDRNNQENYFWEMKDMGDNTYRIFGAALNPTYKCTEFEDCYLGINPNESKTIIFPLLDVTLVEDAQVDWQFIDVETYESFLPIMAIYNKATELGTIIEEAEEYGIDVTAEKSVFGNTASTIEELQEALDSVNEKIKQYKEKSASPDNPQDVTGAYLENYTFDTTYTPWTSTTGCQNNGIATNQCDGVYSYDGFWENWNGSPYTGKMYISLENLPKGVYNVYMAAFTNGAGGAFVYGNEFSTEVTSTGMQPYDVFTIVPEGVLELGLNQPAATGNWMGIDNVRLTYYGNSTASYVYMINQAHNAAPDFESEDVYVQKSALATYKAAYESAVSKTEIAELQTAVMDHFNSLQVMLANYNAYKKYQNIISEVETAFNEEELNGDAAEELGDYLMTYQEDILEAGEMSTEEILAEGERVKALLDTARKQSIKEGQDVTALLTNHNFNEGTNGWTWDTSLGTPAKGGETSNPNVERWNENFDFWQDVEVPNGVYKLKVQSFYRTGSNDVNLQEYQSGTDVIKTFIYLNKSQKAVKNVITGAVTEADLYANAWTFTEGEDIYYIPNSMNDFSHACDRGFYENEVYGIVTDGQMRVGIRSLDGSVGDRWSIWDNFRIEYWGRNSQVLTSVLTDLISQCKEILDQEPIMSNAENEAFRNAVEAAEASLSLTGDEMYDAYIALLAAQSSAEENIQVYAALQTSISDLLTAIEDNAETASQESLEKATLLYEEASEAVNNGSCSTEEAQAMISEIASVIIDLKTPAEPASDENPVDMTKLINNPTFTDGDLSGWLGTSWGRGGTVADGAEQYNKKFDTYQEIVGLKKGTYAVGVQSFYRRGTAENDYAIYTSDDPHSADNSVIYAVGDGTEWQTPLCAPSSVILTEEELPEGVSASNCSVVGGAGNYIPNTMLAADGWFNQLDAYHNTVYVNVGEDKTLRFGAKFVGSNTLASDWSLFDNWTLTYFGTESKHNPVTGIDDVRTVETTSVKGIFNLAGQKLAVPQKGINIIDGKKVLIK